MPYVIGLTGSIGMGKTTTAGMFAEQGIPVWDADVAVARLYSNGGKAVQAISDLYPGAIVNGAVEKERLREWIAQDKSALAKIESAVHPLVAADRQNFLEHTDADIVVLDIPLLFETGAHQTVDLVAVVSTTLDEQRSRVLARPNMTQKQFELLLSKQIPDAIKRSKADYIISTDTLVGARIAVQNLIVDIREKLANA
ncbi:MAG: dephospho-CoA kinase [Paracoccaceae bacterium]